MMLGLAMLVVGVLAFLGIKLLPFKKNVMIVFVIAGLLIVSGIGATLWSGFAGTLSVAPTATHAGDASAYSYNVIATKASSSFLLDENAKVITIPATYNATSATVDLANTTATVANFTIGVADAYADMRGVNVACSTPTFYQQNTSVSDSTQYLIVAKDTAGLADIRISDGSAYQRRARTYLLGGQASAGQSVTTQVQFGINAQALSKLNQYNSQDVTCNVAGQNWVLRVQHIANTA